MPFVTVGTENGADIELHYNNHGAGTPMVLIHGYPLDGNFWKREERVRLARGYRWMGRIAESLPDASAGNGRSSR